MAKMNSMNLYVTTTQIILKSNSNSPNSWQDLYRLIPYLRNSLCCVVCGNLLVDPMSPTALKCQHHLCKQCQGGRKKIKPMCILCKDCVMYSENKQLRTLLQCYKRMCSMLINSGIYKELVEQASKSGAGNLITLIKEGEAFVDDYKSTIGLPKSAYSILPCVYTNSSTQTLQHAQTIDNTFKLHQQQQANARSPLYSVMYAGTGNKITIKRKPKEVGENKRRTTIVKKDQYEKSVFKKPPVAKKCLLKTQAQHQSKQQPQPHQPQQQRRGGCRCGNATPTPGKLTCCGQRCPCYVDGKACIDCKCRGCRNPHTPDGNKIIPHYLQEFSTARPPVDSRLQPTYQQTELYHPVTQTKQDHISLLNTFKIELDTNLSLDQFTEDIQLDVIDSYSDVSSAMSHLYVPKEEEEITVDV